MNRSNYINGISGTARAKDSGQDWKSYLCTEIGKTLLQWVVDYPSGHSEQQFQVVDRINNRRNNLTALARNKKWGAVQKYATPG